MQSKNILSIGAACALAFAPLAYCEMNAVTARATIGAECVKAGGSWRANRCSAAQTPQASQ